MAQRHSPEQDLQIQALHGLQGVELCLARRVDARHLDVQFVATPALVRQVALRMMKGPMDIHFDGQALRLVRFTVHNQNDRTRLVFTAEYTLPAAGELQAPLPPAR